MTDQFQWESYSKDTIDTIEQAHQLYQSNPQHYICNFELRNAMGMRTSYQLDFRSMMQSNVVFNTQRGVRRTTMAPVTTQDPQIPTASNKEACAENEDRSNQEEKV